MAKSVNYATRDYTVEPGATLQIVRQAQFVACLAASSTFKIAFDDGSESDFEAGLTYSPEAGFSRVLIRNPGAQMLTVSLGIGAGAIRDGRVTINAGVTLPVREGAPDVMATYYTVLTNDWAMHQVSAANPLRSELMIKNRATADVFISESAASQNGIAIGAGETIVLKTTSAVYAKTNGTGNLHAVELSWSA